MMATTSSFDVTLRNQQEAARVLYEMGAQASSYSTTTTSSSMPLAPPLTAMAPGMFMLPGQHHQYLMGGFYIPGGFSPFASLPPLPPARAFVASSTTAFAPASQQQPSSSSTNNQRLSVAYLLNQDEAHPMTSTTATATPVHVKREPSSHVFEPLRPSKRKAALVEKETTSVDSKKNIKAKRPRAASVPSGDFSFAKEAPSTRAASFAVDRSPSTTTTSTSPSASAAAAPVPMTFKGDLSLFPHLQLQLHREQLDPQQHTELVLKVWNRQQQVLKLQQLQQKKQELKARRLQQQLQRKGGKVPATASPGSPTSDRPTSPTSPTSPVSSTPGSPSSAASADVVSAALPTLDEILNGADAQVYEVSDEDNNNDDAKKGAVKKPRRRISAQQVAVLEQVFAVEPFPGPSTKKVIAKKLGMKERSITVWFQNKRARLKRTEGGSGSNGSGSHNETEGGRREVTFHNLAVGFDGKLDMLPEEL